MATYNGVNYAKRVAVPSQAIDPGQVSGTINVAYEEYTSAAALTAADIIRLGITIPKGARVTRLVVVSPTNGGTVDVGISGATTKYAAAATAAATTQLSPLSVPTDADNLIATIGGAPSAAGTYKFMVEYVKV